MHKPFAKFMQYRIPRSAGGGDLVMRVLTAGDHDAIVEKIADATKKAAKVTQRLALASVYSVRGEAPPTSGPAAAVYLRKLGGKLRGFILAAYIANHSLTDEEVREIRDSRKLVELGDGKVGVQFSIPGTVQKDEEGAEVEDSEDKFVMLELDGGKMEDTTAGALDGRSPLAASNMLVLESLLSYLGKPTPKGDAGLQALAACPNKLRTAFLMGYQFVHEVDTEEAGPFLAGAVPMMEPPPAI